MSFLSFIWNHYNIKSYLFLTNQWSVLKLWDLTVQLHLMFHQNNFSLIITNTDYWTFFAESSKVVRFHTGWRPSRPFPMDMAGFAVSLKLVMANPEACFDGEAPMGFLESSLLQGLVTMDELEPKADNCSKVRVCVCVCDGKYVLRQCKFVSVFSCDFWVVHQWMQTEMFLNRPPTGILWHLVRDSFVVTELWFRGNMNGRGLSKGADWMCMLV